MRRLCLCTLLLGFVPKAQSSDVPVLTVCEALKDVDKYVGKTIIVVGSESSTDEGAWLNENCSGKLEMDGRSWPFSISLTYVLDRVPPAPSLPRDFRWDKRALKEKLAVVHQTTSLQVLPQYHYSDQWIAFYGRLDAHPRFEVINGQRVQYPGYGHLGAAPAQLVSPANGWIKLK